MGSRDALNMLALPPAKISAKVSRFSLFLLTSCASENPSVKGAVAEGSSLTEADDGGRAVQDDAEGMLAAASSLGAAEPELRVTTPSSPPNPSPPPTPCPHRRQRKPPGNSQYPLVAPYGGIRGATEEFLGVSPSHPASTTENEGETGSPKPGDLHGIKGISQDCQVCD